MYWQNQRLNWFYREVQADTVRDYYWLVKVTRDNIERALVSSDQEQMMKYLERAGADLFSLSMFVEPNVRTIYGSTLSRELSHSSVRNVIMDIKRAGKIDAYNSEFLTTTAGNLQVIAEEIYNIMTEDLPRVSYPGRYVMDRARGRVLQEAFQQRLMNYPRRPYPDRELTEEDRELLEKMEHYDENAESTTKGQWRQLMNFGAGTLTGRTCL